MTNDITSPSQAQPQDTRSPWDGLICPHCGTYRGHYLDAKGCACQSGKSCDGSAYLLRCGGCRRLLGARHNGTLLEVGHA